MVLSDILERLRGQHGDARGARGAVARPRRAWTAERPARERLHRLIEDRQPTRPGDGAVGGPAPDTPRPDAPGLPSERPTR